jgi:hypothetical protein
MRWTVPISRHKLEEMRLLRRLPQATGAGPESELPLECYDSCSEERPISSFDVRITNLKSELTD